ncbi:MAG: 3-methyladenine DNA glycosylase [Hadesarchaea archaeon B3_Hades]|nr:MAG: 3-methyladenine DNA glycosylase [Hadesarchaea archaeon B3_Hades]
MVDMRPIPRAFYERDTATVARELLGKVLVHRASEGLTSGKIVEVEAYYGKGDPASRASRKRTRLNEIMWWHGGLAFVYMVHANWLFNVTTEREGVPGAVLIRALEPVTGVKLMHGRRRVSSERGLTSGPGRLTQAMGITHEHHELDLADVRSELVIVEGKVECFEVASSHRIGVSSDLERELRFYIRGNPFVSR